MKSFLRVRMSTLALAAFCCLIFVASAFPQTDSKPSIAVIPFAESGKAVYGGSELTDLLIGELLSSTKFDVADKAKSSTIEPEMLKAINGETVNATTVTAIGEKTGAKILVIGNVSEYSAKQKSSLYGVKSYETVVKFNLRAVDAKTCQVIFSQTFEKRGVNLDATKAMSEASTKSTKDAAAVLIKRLVSSSPTAN